jgi:hypothetical protein
MEMQNLNKGLKYNLHRKHKTGIQSLVIEADTAINQLQEKAQGYVRELAANKIPYLINKQNTQKENAEQPTQNVSRMEYYKKTKNKLKPSHHDGS